MVSSDDNLNELLDAYLDQQLTEEERIQFEKSARDQPKVAEQIELQEEIDASLKRMCAPPAVPRLKLPSLAELQADEVSPVDSADRSTTNRRNDKGFESAAGNRSVSRRWVLAALATAAAVAWLYVGGELFVPSGREQIAFHQRPLTEVYQECVDQGFSPYWVCDDEITFAKTFEKRQGVKLRLAEMPPSQQMVGLSYLAGLSRKSTSMLALVNDQPVIVFIDRIENDWGPATGDFAELGLTVTRTEKNGLVLYEVSPVPNSDVVKSVTEENPRP